MTSAQKKQKTKKWLWEVSIKSSKAHRVWKGEAKMSANAWVPSFFLKDQKKKPPLGTFSCARPHIGSLN